MNATFASGFVRIILTVVVTITSVVGIDALSTSACPLEWSASISSYKQTHSHQMDSAATDSPPPEGSTVMLHKRYLSEKIFLKEFCVIGKKKSITNKIKIVSKLMLPQIL